VTPGPVAGADDTTQAPGEAVSSGAEPAEKVGAGAAER
jgi:hypothetical protein